MDFSTCIKQDHSRPTIGQGSGAYGTTLVPRIPSPYTATIEQPGGEARLSNLCLAEGSALRRRRWCGHFLCGRAGMKVFQIAVFSVMLAVAGGPLVSAQEPEPEKEKQKQQEEEKKKQPPTKAQPKSEEPKSQP